VEELDAGIELCVWGFLHGAARLGHPESLERLANVQTFFIFMEGTFSVPPHPFKQLYTIRVPFKDVTGTAVYA
jgi:hypothetical protein